MSLARKIRERTVMKTELLVFLLKNNPGYVNARSWSDIQLASTPTETVFLDLENAIISDSAINGLPELPNLRCIDLDSTNISDASMERIGNFVSLEEIWIEDTAVTDIGITKLLGLKNLRFISILGCEISEQSVEALRSSIPGVYVH
jgi:hypothetical protein